MMDFLEIKVLGDEEDKVSDEVIVIEFETCLFGGGGGGDEIGALKKGLTCEELSVFNEPIPSLEFARGTKVESSFLILLLL